MEDLDLKPKTPGWLIISAVWSERQMIVFSNWLKISPKWHSGSKHFMLLFSELAISNCHLLRAYMLFHQVSQQPSSSCCYHYYFVNEEIITLVDFKYLICPMILNKKEAAPDFSNPVCLMHCPLFSTLLTFLRWNLTKCASQSSICASSGLSIWQDMAFLALYMICRIVYSLEISSFIVTLYLYISLAKLYDMYSCTIFLLLLSYKCGYLNHSHVSNYNTTK